MSLKLPADFQRGTQGRDTNLIPFVVIGDYEDDNPIAWIYLSTNNISVRYANVAWSQQCQPILLNIQSIKESIDIDKRTHKISNVTINISNLPYDGKRFSDIEDRDLNPTSWTALINKE